MPFARDLTPLLLLPFFFSAQAIADDGSRASELLETGLELQRQGKHDEAIAVFEAASALPAPDELAAEIRVELAETFFRKGQETHEGDDEGADPGVAFTAAAKLFGEVVERYPSVERHTPYAAYMKGSSHLMLGDMQKAFEAYKSAYFDYPGSDMRPKALVRLGVTLAGQGEAEKAIQIFDVFRREYPEDSNLEKVERYTQQLKIVGQPAPPIRADQWLHNNVSGLGELRGEVVVIVFFATWCKQCAKEVPHLKREIARWRDRGIVFLGVTNPDDPKVVEPVEFFVQRNGIELLDVALDRGGKSWLAYRVTGLPAAAVIDRRGVIRWRGHFAFLGHTLLEKLLKE